MRLRHVVSAIAVFLILAAAVLWVVSTIVQPQQADGSKASETSPATSSKGLSELYVQKVDGLHVTGTPIPVRIEEFRLSVTGAVEHTLELRFEDIKLMEAVTRFMVLECPGTFVDQGDWTGVPVTEVIDRAGPLSRPYAVEFVSIDESYSKVVAPGELDESYLIAYLFDGKEFSAIHGYPLRIAAEGQPGNVWVKWLGEIRVLPRDE